MEHPKARLSSPTTLADIVSQLEDYASRAGSTSNINVTLHIAVEDAPVRTHPMRDWFKQMLGK